MDSDTYKPCDLCGAHCYMYEQRDGEPCWGQVSTDDLIDTEDESGIIVHACEGHRDYKYGAEAVVDNRDYGF